MAKEQQEENEQLPLDNFTWDSTDSTPLFDAAEGDEEIKPVITDEEREQLKDQRNEKGSKKGSENSISPAIEGGEDQGEEEQAAGSGERTTTDSGGLENPEEEPFQQQSAGEEEKKTDAAFFKTLAVELKSAGVFSNIEIKEDEEIDQDRFIELQDAEVEARVDETFNSFFAELDEDGKRFLKFKKEGGDTRKFFETLKKGTDRPAISDNNRESHKQVIRHYLSVYENMPKDDIEDRIEWLETTNKLSKFANDYDKKMTAIEEKEKEELIKKEELRRTKMEEDKVKFIGDVAEKLKTKEEINGIPLTKKDKNELLNYIVKPAVKIGENKYITQFQSDLKNMGANTETVILLAKLLKSNFDLGDLQRKVETKQAAELRKKLDVAAKSKQPLGSSGSSNNKSLSDYF